jgi:chemotaxis protein methyltransferase CheR
VTDADCVAFLQWALPRLGLRWAGFRKVRRQVCRRIAERIRALGLAGAADYRRHIEAGHDEWRALAALCTVSISRFCRDRAVFDALGAVVLPALAQAALERGAPRLECWSAGCASGEEPYSLAILWHALLAGRFPALSLAVLGTDLDPGLIERARAACYRASSLRELPLEWRALAFEPRGRLFCLREPFRAGVRFGRQDLAAELPAGPFDLVLCRNVAFTYFDEPRARLVLAGLASRLRAGGALVIGVHEMLPPPAAAFEPWPGCRAVFRRRATAA